jgi:uncharacterized membrane protein
MNAMSRSVRRAVLTAHIVVSVGLLGDSAGFLAVAVQAATTTDPAVAEGSRETMQMFSVVFGIPLSVLTIVTGVALGLGTKWGVLRHPWVMAKLGLIVSVMLVGALVIGPSGGRDDREALLIAAGAYDVLALCLATGLSVFKPGRRRVGRRAANGGTPRPAPAGPAHPAVRSPSPSR